MAKLKKEKILFLKKKKKYLHKIYNNEFLKKNMYSVYTYIYIYFFWSVT